MSKWIKLFLLLTLLIVLAFILLEPAYFPKPAVKELRYSFQQKNKDKIEKTKFSPKIGEKFNYCVRFGRIQLGASTAEYLKQMELGGKLVDVFTFETKLIRFYDQETIYSDPETFLPVLVERKVSRLLKPEKIREVYDQKNFTLIITKKRWTKEEIVIKKEGPIHNAILLPHLVRKRSDLKIGWSMGINLPQGEFRINLISEEEIKVPAGKFKAYYFTSTPERIKFWISMDENKIPLKIQGIGNLDYRLELTSYDFPQKQ